MAWVFAGSTFQRRAGPTTWTTDPHQLGALDAWTFRGWFTIQEVPPPDPINAGNLKLQRRIDGGSWEEWDGTDARNIAPWHTPVVGDTVEWSIIFPDLVGSLIEVRMEIDWDAGPYYSSDIDVTIVGESFSTGKSNEPFYWDPVCGCWLSFDTHYVGLARDSNALVTGEALRHEDSITVVATDEGVCCPTDMMLMNVFGSSKATAGAPTDAHFRIRTDRGDLMSFIWPDDTYKFHYSGLYLPLDAEEAVQVEYFDAGSGPPPDEPVVYLGMKRRRDGYRIMT